MLAFARKSTILQAFHHLLSATTAAPTMLPKCSSAGTLPVAPTISQMLLSIAQFAQSSRAPGPLSATVTATLDSDKPCTVAKNRKTAYCCHHLLPFSLRVALSLYRPR